MTPRTEDVGGGGGEKRRASRTCFQDSPAYPSSSPWQGLEEEESGMWTYLVPHRMPLCVVWNISLYNKRIRIEDTNASNKLLNLRWCGTYFLCVFVHER